MFRNSTFLEIIFFVFSHITSVKLNRYPKLCILGIFPTEDNWAKFTKNGQAKYSIAIRECVCVCVCLLYVLLFCVLLFKTSEKSINTFLEKTRRKIASNAAHSVDNLCVVMFLLIKNSIWSNFQKHTTSLGQLCICFKGLMMSPPAKENAPKGNSFGYNSFESILAYTFYYSIIPMAFCHLMCTDSNICKTIHESIFNFSSDYPNQGWWDSGGCSSLQRVKGREHRGQVVTPTQRHSHSLSHLQLI